MTLKQVYERFMDSCEYGHTRVEAYKMTIDLYEKLLNSDLKKSIYRGGLRTSLHYSNPCQIMIHGYPILLSEDFREQYDFKEIEYISIDEEFNIIHRNKA